MFVSLLVALIDFEENIEKFESRTEDGDDDESIYLSFGWHSRTIIEIVVKTKKTIIGEEKKTGTIW